MGSSFELGIIHSDKALANQLLAEGILEIECIESVLSTFKEDSLISLLNNSAGISPVTLTAEVFDLIQRSIDISTLTKGDFDCTVGPLKQLYQFKNEAFSLPKKKSINEALNKVGYQKIELDESIQTAYLPVKGMKISFAAIGKGYAADVVKKIWLQKGITSGYINASGDLTAFGTNQEDKPWKIGIADPDNKGKMLFYIRLENTSVATSGDYEQYFIHNGERYSHNINPATGYPLKGIKSVSVFSPSAELSDALATAVYVMGRSKGLDFVNQLPQTHAIIIDDKNTISFSNQLTYETAV